MNLFLGIGKATAIRFAEEGCHVIATDINKDALKQLDDISGTIEFYHFFLIFNKFFAYSFQTTVAYRHLFVTSPRNKTMMLFI